jgi:hypothetical protein
MWLIILNCVFPLTSKRAGGLNNCSVLGELDRVILHAVLPARKSVQVLVICCVIFAAEWVTAQLNFF